jgi:spermidine synthase
MVQTDRSSSVGSAFRRTGPEQANIPALSPSQLQVVFWVFALSGFISIGLEVVWFRVLTLFLRPTVYGFSIMLATVLAGIAIGSAVVAPKLDRRWRWLPVLAALEVAISVTAVLSFGPLSRTGRVTTGVEPWLSRLIPADLVYLVVTSVAAIFPTAFLLGMAFPIGLRLWAQGTTDAMPVAARRIGSFYSANVAGSILGSLATGFVLLPELGSRATLIALAVLGLGSGLALLAVADLRRATRTIAGAAACGLFLGVVAMSPDPLDQFAADRYPGQRTLWKKEGVAATVVVHEAHDGERSLSLNGNHQASTGAAMVFGHQRIGFLPMALHPDPRDALVIGLGGGATAGAVAVQRAVDVDIVELAEEVAEGSRYFTGINHHVLSRPNVHLRIDDGRNHLMMTPRRYDVVTADVILPIHAGSGNLYSAEYFQLLRRVLKPGGIVLQWVAGTEAEYKLIARTFLSVFPDTTAWIDGTLLVGGVDPLRLRRADFDRKLGDPAVVAGLRDLEVETFHQLTTLFRAGPDDLRAFVGPGPVLTDDLPLVEYFLSLPRGGGDVDLSALRGDVKRHVAAE